MMQLFTRQFSKRHLTLLAAVVLLTACATTPPAQHYLLSPLATASVSSTEGGKRLGIGTISLPDYLNRPQLIIRTEGGRLLMRADERWGEPLEDGVRRVLAENLSHLLGPGRLVFLPAAAGITVDTRLQLEITAFDASIPPEIQLSARWSLSQSQGTASLHESRIRLPLASNDTATRIAAMNQALLKLAGEIAHAISSKP